MAKRPTRSQVNDAATAPAQPKPRRSVKKLGPESVAGLEQATELSGASADGTASAGADEPRSDPQPMATGSMSMSSEPTEEDIRMRAYQMYLERGGRHGADFEDWVRAERELRRNRQG